MRVFMIVVMGVAVHKIPVGMLMVVLDNRSRGLSAKTSATLAHIGLLAPAARLLTMT